MKTIGELLQLSTAFLEEKGVFQPRRQVEELLAYSLGLQRMDLYLQHDKPVEEAELAEFRERIRRKAKGEPLEYIVGEMDFYRCKIKITPAALIPRPETEILVDHIVKKLSGQDLSGKVLWDICTGSGCIGIALKKTFPCLKVVLSDLSPEALSLAHENAQQNKVEVEFRLGDLLAPFSGEKADFVTCNPPYISEEEYGRLQPSVAHFEPKMALVGGKSGLEFYQKLALELPHMLNEKGKAFFEIGALQGEEVRKIFAETKNISVEKDWAGLDRFFFLEKQ